MSDDRDLARNVMRPVLALYIGGMGSRKQNFYDNLVKRYGFETPQPRSRTSTWTARSRGRGEAIPAELIDAVSLCGPPDVVRDRLAAFRAPASGR